MRDSADGSRPERVSRWWEGDDPRAASPDPKGRLAGGGSPSSPWLTTSEAAAYVRLHPGALLRKRRRGELAGVRCGSNGKALVFHRGDLDAWLQGKGAL
jgi:excisionase family DNA binding protein